MQLASSVPTFFQGRLYLHDMALRNREVGEKKAKNLQRVITSTLVDITGYLLEKAQDELTNIYFLGPFKVIIEPYKWLALLVLQF